MAVWASKRRKADTLFPVPLQEALPFTEFVLTMSRDEWGATDSTSQHCWRIHSLVGNINYD